MMRRVATLALAAAFACTSCVGWGWPPTLKASSGPITALTFTPDGQRVAVGDAHGTVLVWNPSTGRHQTFSPSGVLASVVSLQYQGGTPVVFAASADGRAQRWDLISGEAHPRLQEKSAGTVVAAVVTQDAWYLATESKDATIRMWEFKGERLLERAPAIEAGRGVVSLSPDGRSVAALGYDGLLRIWDAQTGRQLRRFDARTHLAATTAFSPDGKSLVSVATDGRIHIWEAARGDELSILNGHSKPATALTVSGDNKLVAAGNEQGVVKIWDIPERVSREAIIEPNLSPKVERRSVKGSDTPVTALAFSPDGKHIALGTKDGGVSIWDTAAIFQAGVSVRTGESQEEYRKVKVFYATDRNKAEPSTWSYFFGRFVRSFRGVLLIVICFLLVFVLLVLAFVKVLRPRIAGVAMVSAITVPVVVALAAATVEVGRYDPGQRYGPDRGALDYGTCEVTIPRRIHKIGSLEEPSGIWFIQLKAADVNKHVILRDVRPQPPETFFSDLQLRIKESKEKEAFVFVHGYNSTFTDAARRTAQLAYDLDFDGAAIFYSWPSQGDALQYPTDETNVNVTVTDLALFLAEVAQRSGAERIHLVAHSMGNRALTDVLKAFVQEPKPEHKVFKQIVLAAPDIDADTFERNNAPYITKIGQRTTLYASSRDSALVLSKWFHSYQRAGDTIDKVLVVPPIQTVDVSAVDSSWIGHDYISASRSVIEDLFHLIRDNKAPSERFGMLPIGAEPVRYWIFKP